MSTTQDAFAAWLKAERKRVGMSQQQLVAALKAAGYPVDQSQVSRMESGQQSLSLDWAVAITRVFGVTVDAALKPVGVTGGAL